MRDKLFIVMLILLPSMSLGQQCDSLKEVWISSGFCYFHPAGVLAYEASSPCECGGCFCYTAYVVNVHKTNFTKCLTIRGGKKVQVTDIRIDHKDSDLLSKYAKHPTTVIHFKFKPKNIKWATRRYRKKKSLKYDFLIVDKSTQKVYHKHRMYSHYK